MKVQTVQNISNIVLLISVLQGFVFNGFIFSKKKKKQNALFYLNLIVFFFIE